MDQLHRIVWMRGIITIFLIIHLHLLPFKKYNNIILFDINHLETLSLILLFLLTMLVDFRNSSNDSNIVELIFNFVLFIPIILFIIIIVRYIIWKRSGNYNKTFSKVNSLPYKYRKRQTSQIYIIE